MTDELDVLVVAARDLYNAGFWRAAGVSDERAGELWQRLREAASIAPGSETARALLAAQEPRPESTRSPPGYDEYFATHEESDRDAAPSPAQQTMAADKRERLETAGWQVGSADEFLATPTVEIDERRIQEIAYGSYINGPLAIEALRTAWRESALAERQRTADDARDARRYRWLRDASGYKYGGTGIIPDFAGAVLDAAIDNAMSAQGDA